MPMASRKNINKARDMDKVQKRNRMSTTTAFWIINRMAKPAKLKLKINFGFMLTSPLTAISIYSGAASIISGSFFNQPASLRINSAASRSGV